MAKLGVILKQSGFIAQESNRFSKLSHPWDRPKSSMAGSLVFNTKSPLGILMSFWYLETLSESKLTSLL